MDVQKRHITNRKYRDSGMQGWWASFPKHHRFLLASTRCPSAPIEIGGGPYNLNYLILNILQGKLPTRRHKTVVYKHLPSQLGVHFIKKLHHWIRKAAAPNVTELFTFGWEIAQSGD
ncbi:hypothetical protein J6590_091419 [Homalodisca vitripennis]|nr:hypothetical protein J6590_091419 [Homalodisca vitripennis]